MAARACWEILKNWSNTLGQLSVSEKEASQEQQHPVMPQEAVYFSSAQVLQQHLLSIQSPHTAEWALFSQQSKYSFYGCKYLSGSGQGSCFALLCPFWALYFLAKGSKSRLELIGELGKWEWWTATSFSEGPQKKITCPCLGNLTWGTKAATGKHFYFHSLWS